MSDDLRTLVHAAVLDEAAAADREFPYSTETFGRFRRDVRRRRSAGASMLAVGGLGLAAITTLGMGIWDGTPTPPAVTHTPGPTPSPTPSGTPTPPDWDSQPMTDLEDLAWFDPETDVADWTCGGRPGVAPAMPNELLFYGGVTSVSVDGSTPIAFRSRLAARVNEVPQVPPVVEHPTAPRVVLIRDGAVVAEGAVDGPRVRSTITEPQDVQQDASYRVRPCDDAEDAVPPGIYEARLVQEVALFKEDGGRGLNLAALPLAVLVVSDPILVPVGDWSEAPASGFTPLDVGGSYRRAAEELEVAGVQLPVATVPSCGPAPELQAFDPRRGQIAVWWARPGAQVPLQDLAWESLGPSEAATAGAAMGLTLNSLFQGGDATDDPIGTSQLYFLLDDAGHVVATGGEPLGRGVVGWAPRVTVPFLPCDGGAQVAPGTYTALWVGGAQSNPAWWPETRAMLGLDAVPYPGWLYDYAVIGDITVP